MSECLRKKFESQFTYEEKTIKHKHEYTLDYILEITNINVHASTGYYNDKEYNHVLKCKYCNSFISYKEEGNISGAILGNIETFLKNNMFPFIYADTNAKNPIYLFSELQNVRLEK